VATGRTVRSSPRKASAYQGAEGPTDDPAILELGERQKRNFLATLLFSQGVPMICGGDELARTQNHVPSRC
jgi:pullulanase/glycogen debranching enzyme